MTDARQLVGAWGEQRAADHLLAAGMVLLDRNWRCRAGEIDIIARDGDVLVFVEVKTRRGDAFGTPVDAVHSRKTARLRQLAAQWLAESGLRPMQVRFDVVSVVRRQAGGVRIEHLRNAF
ncbi:MAG TPA: YraN family protein [Micromonosporaceae bacterium]|nr:YraN family protein [Micromonosporaceae bacterium]